MNTTTELHPKPQQRSLWLAARRTFIGGSEIAAILGISPFSTAVDIWLRKTGRAPEQPESEAMRLGTYLEEYVARRFSEESGREVVEFPYIAIDDSAHIGGDIDRLTAAAGFHPATGATINRDSADPAILECKTAGQGWDEGKVPPHYQAQVMLYMGLLGIARADIACVFLAPRREFKAFSIAFDASVFAAMRTRAGEWWERHIVVGEPPLPANEADCKALWARSNPGKTVEADATTAARVAEYAARVAEIKRLEEEAEEMRSDICAAIGDAETLTDPAGKPLVSWKSGKDVARTDWKAVAAALSAPKDIIAAHTVSVPGARRFLLKI